jgi:hypothetical protein
MGGDLMACFCSRIADGGITQDMRDAREWASEAIAAVRLAREPNKWKRSTDEEIAGEILRQIDLARGRDGNTRRAVEIE